MVNKKVGISIGIIIAVAVMFFVFIFISKDSSEGSIYKVTFENNGVIEIVDVKENDTVVKPLNPTREGYTFEGWYYNGIKFDFTTAITKNIKLEARWTSNSKIKWVITFDTAGGKYIENLNVTDGDTIIDIPTPTKEGYKFIGWYCNDEKFDFSTVITKNMLLVAKWEEIEKNEEPVAKTYTVKFDTAGGNTVASKKVEQNKKVLRPSDPKKEGYEFIGWYLGTSEFNFDTKITKDITLTAKWKKIETPSEPETPKTYVVKFDTAGGNTIAEQKIEEGSTVSTPSDPKKEGYTFVGWYYNDVLYNFSTKVTTDISLVAKWEKNAVVTYLIEETDSYVGQIKVFVLRDGVKVDGIVDITVTSGKVISGVEISKDGYVTNSYKIKSINNVRVK